MNRHYFFLTVVVGALCSLACTAKTERPVVREVVRDSRRPSDQALAWSLFQQVQESMAASTEEEAPHDCIARPESRDTDFVKKEMQSRSKRDVERVDIIAYEDGTADVELYIKTSQPSVADLVLHVRERSRICVSFDVQILVSEEGGY